MKRIIGLVLGLSLAFGVSASWGEWQMQVHRGPAVSNFWLAEIDSLTFTDVFVPPPEPTLTLWLDASDDATVERDEFDVVTTWHDKSSFGNDLVLVTGTPTFQANQQNGLPGVLLKAEVGPIDELRGPGTSMGDNDSVTVVVVYQFPIDDYGQTVFITGGVAIRIIGDGSRTNGWWNNGAVVLNMSHGIPTETRGYAFRRSGTEFKGWRADTGETTTLSASTFAQAISSVTLSPSGCCALSYRVRIYEVRVYNEPKDDAFVEAVLAELVAKWGL